MLVYVRAENQDGRVYELVCDGESQPLPNVGDRIETSYMKAEVTQRFFHYHNPNELAVLLKVSESESTPEEPAASKRRF
jgi:hypothetical protein